MTAPRTGPGPASTVGLGDVLRAHARLQRHLRASPCIWSEHRGAFLKLESLQVTGSYKVRGALNALLVQVAAGDRRPVVAASAGNHAAGIAWAARRLGLQAHLVVPASAPASKVARVRRLGATVELVPGGFTQALAQATARAVAEDWRFLHAYDHPDVIAGQGTVAVELLEAAPDVVWVPIGGGGLAAGCGAVLRASGVRVVGVQVRGVDHLRRALAGSPAPIDPAETLADGVRVAECGRLTRRLCAAYLDDIVVVDECEVREAMASLAERDHVMVEGAGAVAVAALGRASARRPAAIVSGGNVDVAVLAKLLQKVTPLD